MFAEAGDASRLADPRSDFSRTTPGMLWQGKEAAVRSQPSAPLQLTNAPRIVVHSEFPQVRSQLNARTLDDPTVLDMPTRFRIWILSLAAVACGTKPAAREAGRDNGDRARVTSETPRAEHDTSVHSPAKPALATGDGAISDAEAVVLAYYAAINAHDYQRAYAAWGNDGPPRRPTLRTFAAGFARTDSVHVVLGAPGRIEGAAGSRYVTIPIRMRTFEHGIEPREYTGSYTVRRSVVPGTDEADRRWHLYSASLR